MSKNKTPVVDPLVLQWLTEVFPDRIPAHDPEHPLSLLDMGRLIGQQEVIRKLRHEMKRQTEHQNTVTAGS